MAGKAKFDQEAAFKSIIGAGREAEAENQEMPVLKVKNKDRVLAGSRRDRRHLWQKGKIRIGCNGRIFWIGI